VLVLALFAFLSGAVTAITPCVLPVLPALLSASASGGRRRVVGVIGGVFITFTIAIVGLASVVDSAGVADQGLRTLAIVVLALFGLTLLLPSVAARIEAPLTRLARFGPKDRGDGFWSGLVVGGALGFVFAPCASPILAAVISVGATQGVSLRLVVVAIAFALGSALVLSVLAFGGRRLAGAIRRAGRGPVLQRALGIVMVATALAMATDADLRFQSVLADHLPSWLVTPTEGLEKSGTVQARLGDLRGDSRSKFAEPDTAAAHPAGKDRLPDLGAAPEFTGNQKWFNTTDGKPLHLQDLRGKVVLVDFWTYTCINCVRTLPYVKAWDRKYRDKGLVIVGVHTPEFSFEKQAGNVRAAIEREGLKYPVAQDNDYKTWAAYGNQYWPAKYLIDANGHVRNTHFGEGAYAETEQHIRTLLAERGSGSLGEMSQATGQVPSAEATPETYLGSARAQGWVPGPPRNGTQTYPTPTRALPSNNFALAGEWTVNDESATAGRGARLFARVTGKRVFLVMSSRGDRRRKVRVLLDGKPHRTVTVDGQRLYEIVGLPAPATRSLELRIDAGVSGYAFTFG
jgi:cytochrome c biogenesis protein CcdA/thiol-disulfide isomerase/thioredoxin